MRVGPRDARRHGRAFAAGLVVAALILAMLAPRGARATQVPHGAAPAPSGSAAAPEPAGALSTDVAPVLSDTGIFYPGLTELVVRLKNRGKAAVRGEIKAFAPAAYGGSAGIEVRAPFAVGAEASVSVALPVRVLASEVVVTVLDETGQEVSTRRLNAEMRERVSLVDVDPSSRLRAAVDEVPIQTVFTPLGPRMSEKVLRVTVPRPDPATGDPVLPERPAGYSSADVVLIKSDVLARLSPLYREALSGYVLAGGTLAVVIVRPEDLHDEVLGRLVGGKVEQAQAPPEVSSDIVLPLLPPEQGKPARPLPSAEAPTPEVQAALVGYYGGNLAPSDFGASATYGLGEVILLAFNPTAQPAVDDPWVQERVVDLARRAFERRSFVAFRPGAEIESFSMFAGETLEDVRRVLDPNENTRWAIAVAALLLCLYAVLAGPLNFSLASKRGRPLSALRHLPIYALVAFVSVVAIGVSAKGLDGRARHLSLIEAGGGVKAGTIRRFRGFYTSQSEDLTVSAFDPTSILTIVPPDRDRQADRLLVDRQGLRLTDVAALPWQTVVAREDGFAALGGGVTLAASGSDVVVENKTGRALRAVLLRMPGGDTVYFAQIAPGDRVTASSGRALGKTAEEKGWLRETASTVRAGMLDLHPLAAERGLSAIVEADAPELAEAWAALERAAGDSVDWFPPGVPVMLAQIDGGEGKATDAGLSLESDRLLLRVVGYGGAP